MNDHFHEESGIAYRSNTFELGRETLVFIHGLGAACSIWQPIESSLERDFNVVTYDLRGHGLSRKYNRYADYDLDRFADDLNELLAILDISSCTLVSHSMGTIVALTFLRRYPGKIRRNLFISPVYKLPASVGAGVKRLIRSGARFFDRRDVARRPGRRMDYSLLAYSPDLSPRRIFPEIWYLSLPVYLFCLSRVYSFTADEWWSQIAVTTTILHGTNDTFAPYASSVELAKQMPNATLVTVEGANHMLVTNNRQAIVELLLASRFRP